MTVNLLGPQFTWTFYANAAICLLMMWPLFAPESVVPFLAGSCEAKEYAGTTGAVLAATLQLYAALAVVQAKMLRHAAATPADLKFHSVLAQGYAAACAFSVGAVVMAEGTGFFEKKVTAPMIGIFTLLAARYGGGLNRLRWAAAVAPKDALDVTNESEFERGAHVEMFMLWPVPPLTRVFQGHAFMALVSGASAFVFPEFWALTFAYGTEGEVMAKCPETVSRLIIQLYGALIIGNFWIAWKAARLGNVATRRRLTESWAAMFTASFVITLQAFRIDAMGWLGVPSGAIFATVAVCYWSCYMEPDVVPGTEAAVPAAAAAEPVADKAGKNSKKDKKAKKAD